MHTPSEDRYTVTPRRAASPMAVFLAIIGGCLVLSLILSVVLVALMFPVFSTSRTAARKTACLSNVKQVSTGLLMYMQDYDNRLPPAAGWQDGVMPYVKNTQIFSCPEQPYVPSGYAYNGLLDRRSLDTVQAAASAPLIYDSFLGLPNGADSLESFAARHSGVGTLGFADGHVASVTTAPPANSGLAPAKPKSKKKPSRPR